MVDTPFILSKDFKFFDINSLQTDIYTQPICWIVYQKIIQFLIKTIVAVLTNQNNEL